MSDGRNGAVGLKPTGTGAIARFAIAAMAVFLAVPQPLCAEVARTVLPADVAVAAVEVATLPLIYAVPGSVVSDDRVEISSRVVGFIRQLDVREGQKVARGDVLVRIDPSDINQAILQAAANVRAAERDLADAEIDAGRYERLTASGSVAKETLRKTMVRVDLARAALVSARSVLASAEAQRDYATIVSPVNGTVVSVAKRSGEMATAGATMLTVESSDVLLLKTYIAENSLAQITRDTPVVVRLDALAGQEFAGRIRGIVPSGDNITRRYEVDIVLPVDPALVPGMFGRAEFVLGQENHPVVPIGALVDRGGLTGVFVVADGKAWFRWLRLGPNRNGAAVVTAGLSGGETILTRVDGHIRDGETLRPPEAQQ